MKAYLYGAAVLAVIGGLAWSHTAAYNAGKNSILTKLSDQRVTVLKDGKAIDEDVLNSNDDGLLCKLLDNCGNPAL